LERPGLEAVFRLEAGAQIGFFHVGPTVEVLVPLTDRDAVDRSVRVFGGLGVSFVLGN